MRKVERPSESISATTEPLPSFPLPPELVARFGEQPRGVGLLHGTDTGTVVLVREPVEEIRRLLVPVRMHLHHELHAHPLAPVLRTRLRLPDRPDHQVLVQAYTNVADPLERATFAAVAEQKGLLVLLYDDELHHRLSKRLPLNPSDRETVGKLLAQAERRLAGIPQERFDFEQAKTAIISTIKL